MREETRCRHMGYSSGLTVRVLLYAQSHRHITAFVTPVVEHWLEREIAQWVHPMNDRSALTTELHLAPNQERYTNKKYFILRVASLRISSLLKTATAYVKWKKNPQPKTKTKNNNPNNPTTNKQTKQNKSNNNPVDHMDIMWVGTS